MITETKLTNKQEILEHLVENQGDCYRIACDKLKSESNPLHYLNHAYCPLFNKKTNHCNAIDDCGLRTNESQFKFAKEMLDEMKKLEYLERLK